MAYARRVNLQNSMVQQALRQSDKGSWAVPGARRGQVIQSFAAQEGARLSQLDRAGAERREMRARHRAELGLRSRGLDIEAARLHDAKKGSRIATGIGLIQTGLAFTDSRAAAQETARQEEFNRMEAQKMYQNRVTRDGYASAEDWRMQFPLATRGIKPLEVQFGGR